MDTHKIQTLDSALVQAAGKIKVLKVLAWPAEAEVKFLEGWRKNNPLTRKSLSQSVH
jgi:hypothetical protein